PRAFGDERREATRRRQEHVARFGGNEHERAALRLHVVANEREQAVDELSRIRDGRIELEHTLDEVERPRTLTQRLAASMQLHVRLLELAHGRGDVSLDLVGMALRLPCLF